MLIADANEFNNAIAAPYLNPEKRAELGQFMTPATIGRFMASLFSDISGNLRILDPGAGAGSLTAAIVERICHDPVQPDSASLTCYEIAPELIGHLKNILHLAVSKLTAVQVPASAHLLATDFIHNHSSGLQTDIFTNASANSEGFTHVIMNPPYRKIHSRSLHRAALRKAGIETSNLYSGFMFISALLLRNGGEMVAIVPRSFCSGPYFKKFRKQFFAIMGLQNIHLFDRRDIAFRRDRVLQENIIIHAVKGDKPARVSITVGNCARTELQSVSAEGSGRWLAKHIADYSSVIRPNDPDKVVHIVTDDYERDIADSMYRLTTTIDGLGLAVSTGPVVEFRARPLLLSQPDDHSAPLLYPAHFQGNQLEWPREMKRPNAIKITDSTKNLLWENRGCYVVTRRFSAKEDPRRIVASVYQSNLPGELIGFENHLNVFHSGKRGVNPGLAAGLSIYLNSTFVDKWFRQYNGHTQVNAADLRALRYPERKALERIGATCGKQTLTQERIDAMVDNELAV